MGITDTGKTKQVSGTGSIGWEADPSQEVRDSLSGKVATESQDLGELQGTQPCAGSQPPPLQTT